MIAIKEVDGKKDKNTIKQFIDMMPALDSRKLRAYMAKIEPDVLMNEEVICRHCGVESRRKITMGYEFFWPQYIDE